MLPTSTHPNILQGDISMTTYCTYLTVYSGNKLPPFYIGSSSIDRVNKGYRGSVLSKMYKETWKNELLTNPHLFKTRVLTTHNGRKEATIREKSLQKSLSVVKNPLYINRAYAQIEGSHGNPSGPTCYGRVGAKHPMYGKRPHNFGKKTSDAIKKRISQNHHDVSGSNNPRALTHTLTSPEGINYTICGKLEHFCKEHYLGIALLKKHQGSFVPKLSKSATHQMSKNTVGWRLITSYL